MTHSIVKKYLGKQVRIGLYAVKVTKFLSMGGSSFLFLAQANPRGRLMILKVTIPTSPKALEWAKEEVRLHKSLQHQRNNEHKYPQIVSFLDSATNPLGHRNHLEVCMLMEHCPGGSLHDYLASRNGLYLPENELLSLFLTLCIPVHALHRHQPPIAHRDLKPEHFVRDFEGRYKLCDFGSAVEGPIFLLTKDDRVEQSEDSAKRTTAMYRAPELADIEGTAMFSTGCLTEAVDVWAMGCLLYTMAYFKPPFSSTGLRTDKYSIPSNSPYSSELHEIIRRMLTTDMEKRSRIDHVIQCLQARIQDQPLPPWDTMTKLPRPPSTYTIKFDESRRESTISDDDKVDLPDLYIEFANTKDYI